MSRPPTEPPPGRRSDGSPPDRRPPSAPPPRSASWLRYLPWALVLLLIAVFFIPQLSARDTGAKELTYSQFVTAVENGQVKSVDYNKSNGDIKGEYHGTVNGATEF